MDNQQNSSSLCLPGEIIVGDQDSLTIFASEAQNQLRLVSKTITEISMHSTQDLELIINEIILEMDAIQASGHQQGKRIFPLYKSRNRMKVVCKYTSIYKSINDMTLALQLQQATLIKENSRLKSIVPVLKECSSELEKHISHAQTILDGLNSESYPINLQVADSPKDILMWQSRLERKLEDIRISHTVSLQNIAQAQAMIANNEQIIDRITAAVTNSIPIWRTQVTLCLNLEKTESILWAQNNMGTTMSQSLEKTTKGLHSKRKETAIDWDLLSDLDQALYNSLKSLLSSERKCTETHQTFPSTTTIKENSDKW